jgi:hypothetical protein
LQAGAFTQQKYDKEKEEAIAFCKKPGKKPKSIAAFLGHHTHGSFQIMLGEGVQYLHEHDITPQTHGLGWSVASSTKASTKRCLEDWSSIRVRQEH